MRTTAITLLATAIAGITSAAPAPTTTRGVPLPEDALVVVEASHGGAGSGLTNTTITVPIGTVYTNEALAAVSTLYLLSPNDGVCTPYLYANGTGARGAPFHVGEPSRLSTNTVVVGSVVCETF
ncbi:hypothetical protein F4777DRAFT_579986 [Nemania sp. FL0916]|nr:hypothetical protein F4777DRAFT_579986 [Nemania sp. FL0916]